MKNLGMSLIMVLVALSGASPARAWVSGYGCHAGSRSVSATHTNAFGGSTTRTASASYAGGYHGAATGGYYGAAATTTYHAAGWGYGGHYCTGGAYYSTGTNWGDVAAGAAIGAAGVATGMAIAHSSSQPAVSPLPVGSVVYALPSGCKSQNGVYVCSSGYYQPYYQGTTIVYRVIPAP